MGIKEDTCWDEYWVLYVSDESLNSIPKTNITLYVNWNLNKNLNKKKTRIYIYIKARHHEISGHRGQEKILKAS